MAAVVTVPHAPTSRPASAARRYCKASGKQHAGAQQGDAPAKLPDQQHAAAKAANAAFKAVTKPGRLGSSSGQARGPSPSAVWVP